MQGDYEEDNTFTKDSDTEDGTEQVVQNASIEGTPARFTRRGLHSKITLGEEMI